MSANAAPATPKPWMNKYAAQSPVPELTPEQLELAIQARAVRAAAKAESAANPSTGPRTPQGKAISAQNARKHGFAGSVMIIDDEDLPAYEAHLDAYHAALMPANQVEADAVRLAANALWRTDRLTSIESGLLDLEIAHQSPHIDGKLKNLSIHHFMAIGFMEQTNSSSALDLCRRYLSSAQRDFQRAIDTFHKLKENRAALIPVDEPKPEIHLIQHRPPNELAPKADPQPQKAPRTKPAVDLKQLHALKTAARRGKNRR